MSVELKIIREILALIKDYSDDSESGSDYQLACEDLYEAVQMIEDRFKPYD